MIYKTMGVGGDFADIVAAVAWIRTQPTGDYRVNQISDISTSTYSSAVTIPAGLNIEFTCDYNKTVKNVASKYLYDISGSSGYGLLWQAIGTGTKATLNINNLKIRFFSSYGSGVYFLFLNNDFYSFTFTNNIIYKNSLMTVALNFVSYHTNDNTIVNIFNNILSDFTSFANVVNATLAVKPIFEKYLWNNTFINCRGSNFLDFSAGTKNSYKWSLRNSIVFSNVVGQKCLGSFNVNCEIFNCVSTGVETNALFVASATNKPSLIVGDELISVDVSSTNYCRPVSSGNVFKKGKTPSAPSVVDYEDRNRIFPYSIGAYQSKRLCDLLPF